MHIDEIHHYFGKCETFFYFFFFFQTIFLDVKAVGYSLSFVRQGRDPVGSLYRLRNHGVGKIKDATSNGLIQPLGNAICIGILH